MKSLFMLLLEYLVAYLTWNENLITNKFHTLM